MIKVGYGVDYFKYLKLLMIRVFQMIQVDFGVYYFKYLKLLMI
jgi:hypothetical protein